MNTETLDSLTVAAAAAGPCSTAAAMGPRSSLAGCPPSCCLTDKSYVPVPLEAVAVNCC